ncbi:hypothetical protein J5N97_007464 [Dioscorea zingiberensis]|uniref:DRBM domain-containing protein n=1 Tax=Dioscorea zingiberensis TaxID=325984 RepID=A0A9D5DDH6_9LILI|nr:hypothetical protein J5N97_007464 [Dioscorea zingiberensis]
MEFVPARNPEQFTHKNKLQEHAQKSAIPLPVYHTTCEGTQHAPRFRSVVVIDGVEFVSSGMFSNRKEAEQDVARVALEGIYSKTKQDGIHLIYHDKIFCKSILNEYATKVNLNRPIYTTVQSESLIPMFVSTLVFGGKSYTGGAGKNKKEAEQLAARAAIEFILSSSDTRTLMSQIIKSKSRLYATICGTNNSVNAGLIGCTEAHASSRTVTGEEFHATMENNKLPTGHNSEAFPSCQHINVEVSCSVPPELKNPIEEFQCGGNPELSGTDPSVPDSTQGGPLSGFVTNGLELTPTESYSQLSDQAIASASNSTVPDDSQVMSASHSKKRSRKKRNKGEMAKRTRTDENFVKLPANSCIEEASGSQAEGS